MTKHHQNLTTAGLLLLIIISTQAQFLPTWTTSLYMQAKTFSIVTGISKTSGTYPTNITFSGNYPSPSLALSIPQLRLVANSNTMDFKCSHSTLTETGFSHSLVISNTNTVVWYLQVRYFVVSLTLLPNTFQAGFYDGTTNVINAGSGTTRTENFNNTKALSYNMSMTQSPKCVPFVTGVNATSADHYQLNVSCTVTSETNFTLTASVHPNTLISTLTVYVLLYDPVGLANQSLYFVDFTLTSNYLGSQIVTATLPYGYYDSNFIGGMDSFSIQNNIEYNITLAIPISNVVYTSPSSLYDSVPQVQIRVRLCPTAYPNYNTADGLCYTVCPLTTYYNSAGFVCYACGLYCLTCLNSTVCTNCTSTMILQSGTCICPLNSYNYNGNCYGCDYTCKTCTSTGQFYNCLSCNSSNHRSILTAAPPYNNTCPCDPGFFDSGSSMCTQTCGDGQAITDQCDDGNSNDGDGCSSSCVIEANFTCQKDINNFSSCYYIGNVTISLNGIFKQQFSNTVQFFVVINPYIPLMSELANPLTLTSNGTCFKNIQQSTYFDVDEPDIINLVYKVTYTQPIQDTYLRINLKPTASGIFSRIPPTNITFQCDSSNAYQLIVYQEDQYIIASNFRYVCLVFGYLMLATAPLYIFGRLKWVGNMLFLSLQFQYLNMAILNHFSPMLSGLSYFKAVMGYNELMGIHPLDIPKYPSFLALRYNMAYSHNINFMVSFQALGIVMYIIYYIFWRRNELVCKKYGGDPEKTFNSTRWGKFLSFFNWQFFMFFNLFNMTPQILSMIISSEIEIQVIEIPLQIFCMVCIFLAIAPLLFKRKEIPSYTRLLYYKDRGQQEQLVTIGAFVVMYLLFYIARTQNILVYYVILVIPLTLIIYMLCRKPFQSKWIRAAYFINNFCIIMTLIYNRLTIDLSYKVEYLPFGNFIMIVFDWIFNLVVWARQAYIICKYGGEEGLNQILQSNTKTTEEADNTFNDYFKPLAKNASVLESTIRQNNRKLSNNNNRRRREKQFDPDYPEQLRKQKQKILEQQQNQEREEIKKKREEWSKEMQEMKEIRELRERTRESIRSKANALHERFMPTTRSKGIQESRIQQLDGATTPYL